MSIAAISGISTQMISALQGTGSTAATQPEGTSFGKVITDAIEHVDQVQQQADTASIQVASGQSADLSGALLKVEEASLAVQLTMQVRNKIVESYQEIMRMPV